MQLVGSAEAMEAYSRIKKFMTSDELEKFTDLIHKNTRLFSETLGRGTLGPRYCVINGDQIRSQMPEVETFGEERVRPITEKFAGHPLQLMVSLKRSMRIQVYRKKHHGFRWHFDEYPYVALLTLKNTNRGQTHVISQRLSQFLRFPFYPLYAVPQVFSLMPYKEITVEAGDLLLMRGSRVLHRGVILEEEGERIIMAFWYDRPGKQPNPLRDKIARALNF